MLLSDRKASSREALLAILSFFSIYIIWGSTYLAIRITVADLPPFFAAGVRFLIAGGLLYGFVQAKSRSFPTGKQWRNLAIVALLMFFLNYGALFWSERYLPSGIASVLVSMIPLITVLFETVLLRQEKFRWQLLLAILMGLGGVMLLMLHEGSGTARILPSVVLLCGSTCWCLGSVLARSFDLPASKPLTSGAEMLLGGLFLILWSAIKGEMHPLPHLTTRSVLALLYLIFFGSLLAYTAYVWLLGHMPATRVASYAYVNPVVAVALGYFFGGEAVTSHTLLGTGIILASVLLTLQSRTANR